MFFGSHASAVAKCDRLSHTFESTPVAPDDMNESTTPVASACDSSAAWIVSGCAPTIAAMRVVAGL